MSDYFDQQMRAHQRRIRHVLTDDESRALIEHSLAATENPDLAEAAVVNDECRISRILGLQPCPEDHALTLIRACPTCKAAL